MHSSSMLGAITAAILSVLAAIGSLLSSHAANQAILLQSKASDQWAYYQSKSTKGHLYDVSKQMIMLLSKQASTENFDKQIEKYDKEKKEIQDKASHLEEESNLEFQKHLKFALAVSTFQVGIVLASVSILVGYRWMLFLSLLAGIGGSGLLLNGWLLR